MDLKSIVMLALQVSIMCMVFGFGLKSTPGDLLYVLQRPGLLARSLLAVFVLMPAVVGLLSRLFDFPHPVEVALMALALSPVPPLLPMKEAKAGGHNAFALGLMAILALSSIVVVPALLEILQRVLGRQLVMAPGAVAALALKSAVLPLAAGMLVRTAVPSIAGRVEELASLVAKVLMPAALVVLIASAFSAMWALIGAGTLLAIAIFTVAGLGIGHVLGGPDPEHAAVLALSTACRHPAIALGILAANFPDQQFVALILLYLLANAVIGLPYVRWQQRQAMRTMAPA